jgi:biopolymer transport protein ExbB
MRLVVLAVLMAAVLMLAALTTSVRGQEAGKGAAEKAAAEKGGPAEGAKPKAKQPVSLLEMIWDGTFIGGSIQIIFLALSVSAVALCIEHVMHIRHDVLMPPGLAEQTHELLKQGQTSLAEQQCRMQPSFLSYVLHAGLSELDGGWSVVEKSMEDTAAEQAARLFRKIEYLSVIANLAPMLGLLGTVIGMVVTFKTVAETQGVANVSDLAGGIYLALITTVEGLVIAIPTLAAFAYFRNRVEQLVAEAGALANHVFTPLRRRTMAKTAPQARPAAAPAAGVPAQPLPPAAGAGGR